MFSFFRSQEIPELAKAIIAKAEKLVSCRKVYIRYLPQDITLATLRSYFREFGPIVESNLKTDKANPQKCSGYAFIVYKDIKSTENALKEPVKTVEVIET